MWIFKRSIYDSRRADTCTECVAHEVQIGTQRWTGCNATLSVYRNGDTIPQVSDPTAWSALTTGAWCHYNNDPANDAIYGKLYNWFAINDVRGLAPTGYHVPTNTEFTTLVTYLGGSSVAGGKMKEQGLCHWNSPNVDATDTSLFTGLPGGTRSQTAGTYSTIGDQGGWWSSTELIASPGYAWYLRLDGSNGASTITTGVNGFGRSVRFIKDLP
jgi:uncharacterized protein (TIGR02145 family)